MRSCNLELRKAIMVVIGNNITFDSSIVPIFYNFAPPNTNGNYIVFSIPNQREIGTFETGTVAVNVQLKIYTSSINSNSGVPLDRIAEQLYNLLYTNKESVLVLGNNFNNFGVSLQQDIITSYIEVGNQVYIDRQINFEYKISS